MTSFKNLFAIAAPDLSPADFGMLETERAYHGYENLGYVLTRSRNNACGSPCGQVAPTRHF